MGKRNVKPGEPLYGLRPICGYPHSKPMRASAKRRQSWETLTLAQTRPSQST